METWGDYEIICWIWSDNRIYKDFNGKILQVQNSEKDV